MTKRARNGRNNSQPIKRRLVLISHRDRVLRDAHNERERRLQYLLDRAPNNETTEDRFRFLMYHNAFRQAEEIIPMIATEWLGPLFGYLANFDGPDSNEFDSLMQRMENELERRDPMTAEQMI